MKELYNADVEYYDLKSRRYTDPSVSFKVGERISTTLASCCPAVLNIFMMIAEGDSSKQRVEAD
jgi:hypothetical protein